MIEKEYNSAWKNLILKRMRKEYPSAYKIIKALVVKIICVPHNPEIATYTLMVQHHNKIVFKSNFYAEEILRGD